MSRFARFALLLVLALGQFANTSPLAEERKSVSVVSTSTISALTIYGQFSRAAYCHADLTWSCGASCDAIPGFVPYLAGGDGDAVPHYFVGYWPAQNTAVVVHEGTEPTHLLSLLTDAKVLFTSLDPGLFPGIDPSIKVHSGFVNAQAAGAKVILAAVKRVFSDHGISRVTLVGHSLGAAISTIEGVYLKLALPPSTTFKHVLHGSPRVGNQQFADYIDAHFLDFTRINHDKDPIPIVPGRFLGYVHASGEDHIQGDGTWYACAGRDNTDANCSTGDVPNIVASNIIDHLGPYNGVWPGFLLNTSQGIISDWREIGIST